MMITKHPASKCLIALAAILPVALTADLAPTDYQSRPGIFKVTTDVVNEDVPAFTVTGPAFGNTLKRTGKGAFEPATFRTQLVAQKDAPNRIYDNRGMGIAFFDSYNQGYLDGADVRVYRLVNGEIQLVREDTVAEGGTVIENWNDDNPRKVIPAGTTSGQMKWADWNRPGSTRWYTVFAVDTSGNLSAPAEPLKFEQRVAEKGAKEQTKETNFRAKQGGDREAPPAPTGFSGGYNAQGILEFSWDPVQADDLAGYRLARSDTPPSAKRGDYLQRKTQPATSTCSAKSIRPPSHALSVSTKSLK